MYIKVHLLQASYTRSFYTGSFQIKSSLIVTYTTYSEILRCLASELV